MVREFTLPDVGEGVTEGELVSWLVAEGDTVHEDQPVAEVETDKALVEIPSPVDGTVRELLVEAGAVVPVGDVIITFDAAGETSEPVADDDETQPETPESEDSPDRIFAPPHVRRLARKQDVDLATIDGSGPGGRITAADVEAATADGSASSADGSAAVADSEPPAPTTPTESVPDSTTAIESSDTPSAEPARERTLAAPATRRLAREAGVDIDTVPTNERRDGEAFVTPEAVEAYAAAQQEAQSADAVALDAESTGPDPEPATADNQSAVTARIPYRGVRKTIGDQMVESAYTAPHVTHHDMAVVDELVETRQQLKPHATARDVTLTYLPFVMKAVDAALAEFPIVNSRLDEDHDEIVQLADRHFGVAVATEAGLMVPVVTDVDEKGLVELAAEIDDLATKARERTIDVTEMRGGTFTITNFGAIGGEYATPIINYPEVAILGLGELRERPVVEDSAVIAAHTLPLSLSIDHRVVDGADAAAFTNKLIEYLETPSLLLLE